MSKHGGKREGAGRKPKADEVELVERLTPFEDKALQALKKGVEKGEFPFVKLFFEYRFGKAKETINLNDITPVRPPRKVFIDFNEPTNEE